MSNIQRNCCIHSLLYRPFSFCFFPSLSFEFGILLDFSRKKTTITLGVASRRFFIMRVVCKVSIRSLSFPWQQFCMSLRPNGCVSNVKLRDKVLQNLFSQYGPGFLVNLNRNSCAASTRENKIYAASLQYCVSHLLDDTWNLHHMLCQSKPTCQSGKFKYFCGSITVTKAAWVTG